MDIRDILYTSLETITAFGIGGEHAGDHLFTLDELQNASIANTQEKQDITGKGGRKLSSIKRNKGATVSGASGIVSGGLMAMQTGCDFNEGTYQVQYEEYLTVDANLQVKLKYAPAGAVGSEVQKVYIKGADGKVKASLVQASAADDGYFKYEATTADNVTTYTLTFDSDNASPNDEAVVYYKRNAANAQRLENLSDKYSGKAELFIDAIGEDKCGNIYHVQFHFPKADFNGEFTIDLGDNQTVQNFEAEALAGACGAGGKLWDYTVFED